jgi:hypothetical protein
VPPGVAVTIGPNPAPNTAIGAFFGYMGWSQMAQAYNSAVATVHDNSPPSPATAIMGRDATLGQRAAFNTTVAAVPGLSAVNTALSAPAMTFSAVETVGALGVAVGLDGSDNTEGPGNDGPNGDAGSGDQTPPPQDLLSLAGVVGLDPETVGNLVGADPDTLGIYSNGFRGFNLPRAGYFL